jgi:hypothetical protein
MKKTISTILAAALAAAVILSACSIASPQATASPAATEDAPQAATVETTVEGPSGIPVCDLPLPGPEDWPVYICDSFNGTHQTFPAEIQNNAYARYEASVSDGQFYQIEYAAKGFAQFQRTSLTWFDIAKAQDFALSITGKMNSTFKEVSWGIGFRGSEEKGSFFLLSIFNDSTYAFEIYENENWISLVSRRPFNGILAGDDNTLTVLVEGRSFKFLINNQPVEGFDGGLLEGIEVFLAVSAKEGASAVFSFDNLVMQI